jgi:CcmD family protein
MDNLGFLGIAYAIVWIALAAYLFSIVRRQRSLEKRMDELQRRDERDNPRSR